MEDATLMALDEQCKRLLISLLTGFDQSGLVCFLFSPSGGVAKPLE